MRRKTIRRQLLEAGFALAVTYAAGRWAVHYAYLERGYAAAGGEYIFILAVYWVAYKFIQFVFDVARVLGGGED